MWREGCTGAPRSGHAVRVSNLARLDLNLLAPLAALLDERHVSRAAERVHLTQPAMSRTLKRLREVFGDELLVRTSSGYRLTPAAERLRRRLRTLLPELADLFAAEEFVPATAAEVFRLSGTDYAVDTIGVPLSARLRRDSPGSSLHMRKWHESVFDELERGELDLALYGYPPPPGLRTEQLFEERFVCVVDPGHPLARRPKLELDDYLRGTHVVVDIRDGRQGVVDADLRAHDVARTVGLIVPHHRSALLAVVGSDLIATLPRRMLCDADGVAMPAPPDVLGTMTYSMSWHPSVDSDPAHRWLRALLRAGVGET
jgi:DNA-binding transcriptional LysR family regulator